MTLKQHFVSLSVTLKAIVIVATTAVLIASNVHAGPIMHLHDDQGRLGTVDVETGDVNVIGSMGRTMTDIAFDTSGNLWGITFTGFYSIDAGTAEATYVGRHNISDGNALVFDTDGTLYAAGNTTSNLYSISTASGSSTSLGSMGFFSGGDLAFNSGGFYLASNTAELVSIDLNDVSGSSSVGSFGVNDMFGLATGDDGELYGVADSTSYSIDLLSGQASDGVSFAGQGMNQAYGQSFYTEARVEVPEPGTLALFSLGLLGLGAARCRSSNA